MSKLWPGFAVLVVVIATGFCVQLQRESERRLRALEERADDNWHRDMDVVSRLTDLELDGTSKGRWWCTAPALGPTINREIPGQCYLALDECKTAAGIIGSTCIIANAPWCFDVGLGRSGEPAVAVDCYFGLPTCQEHRRHHTYARSDCYRADGGFANVLARKGRPE